MMNCRKKLKIAVISTVHDTYDTRIFYKQILSLRSNHNVLYFSPLREEPDFDWIVPLYKSTSKAGRLLTHISLINRLSLSNVDLYLLHDPELMPLGIFLKLISKNVVWDMHEDTYNDIKTKTYMKPIARRLLAFIYKIVQRVSFNLFDGFILAEDEYRCYFDKPDKFCIVHNYPLLDQLNSYCGADKEPETIVYIGSITKRRGIYQLLDVVSELKKQVPNIKLILIGPFSEQGLEDSVRECISRLNIDSNVVIHGPKKNVEAYPVLAKCMVGLALLLPEPNIVNSLPTKMFEYMSLGLPVVVSDFPLWRDIVKQHEVGEVVDPFDIRSISDAISKMIVDKELYDVLSRNARQAAQQYSWETENATLQAFVDKVVAKV